MSNPEDRQAMRSQLTRISKHAHIMCLQECHGFHRDVLMTLRSWFPAWHIEHSGCFFPDGTANPNAGGVIIAICQELCAVATFNSLCLIPGRVLSISLFCMDQILTVLNVHNFDLSLNDMRIIRRFMNNLNFDVKANPTLRLAVLAGDINIKAENEMSYKIGSSSVGGQPNIGSVPNPMFRGQRVGQWKNLLSSWTEIVQPLPTHFDKGSHSCTRIDRAWVLGPSNMLVKMHIRLSLIHISEPTRPY